MFLSFMHNWSLDSTVKQVLLFNTLNEKELFENKLKEKNGSSVIEDDTIGAVCIFRVIQTFDRNFRFVIRSGIDGRSICKSATTYVSADQAMNAAFHKYVEMLSQTFGKGYKHAE